MEQLAKRRLGVKVFRLAEVQDGEWQTIMLRYRTETKVWWLFPTSVWVLLLIVALGLALFEGVTPLLRLEGLVLALFAAGKIGARFSQRDGFQFGYDLGRWDGVCRALDIDEREREELYFLARGLIYAAEPQAASESSCRNHKQTLTQGPLQIPN